MKNRNYKVNRNQVYVGEVIEPHFSEISNTSSRRKSKINVHLYYPCRSMLFVPTEQNLANDLLYQSPNYSIVHYMDNRFFVCTMPDPNHKKIVIQGAYQLEPLLKYFGYQETLTYQDIVKIRKTFFTGRFGMDHCKLFGMEEFIPDDFKFYKHGKEVTDPDQLHERYKQGLCLDSHRTFGHLPDSVLPRELMDVLDKRGNHSLLQMIKWDEKLNSFTPDKKEGPIKKLTKF